MTTIVPEGLTRALADRYRVERELGAGGMATVYLAHDLKHDRDVAIKVLHPDLGAALGSERFLTEIRTTARLQHPHILPLLDSGEAEGLLFYVMPFVPGETLRARLERERQLPIPDALRIAREVADALGHAHAQGVIHRDVKPENILLHDGHALVADFGIALAVQSAGGARMTQTGLSLGTPQYMSPEQAMGERIIDARSDVYALGAVTYEMLAGDPPFTGGTVQAIVAKVLTEKPMSLHTVRDTVPAAVEQAVLTALAKLPADRFATPRAFVEAFEHTTNGARATYGVSSASSSRAPRAAAIALSTLVAFASAVGWWRAAHHSTAPPPVQFGLILPDGVHVANGQEPMAVSPDGRTVAVTGESRDGRSMLYVRAIGEANAVPLAGTDGADQPSFSPSGAWIAFVSGGQLKKVRTAGGDIQSLAEVGDTQGLSWGSAGLIFVANNGRLAVVPENGGTLRALEGSNTPNGTSERYPIALADGKSVLYTSWTGNVVGARVMHRTIESAPATAVGVDSAMGLGVVRGWLVSGGSGGIVAMAPLNPTSTHATGPSRQVFQGVAMVNAVTAAFVASDGTFIYVPGSGLSDLVLLEPGGDTTLVADDRRDYQEPRLSPDGKRIATAAGGRNGIDLWIIDRATRTSTRLTSDGRRNSRPEWMPDGAHLIYRTLGDSVTEIQSRRWDGSDAAVRLQANPRLALWEGAVSPNGEWLLYRTGTLGTADIYYRRLAGDTTSHAFVATPGADLEGRFSPDGRWVAYTSAESGLTQVFVRAFPTGDVRVQVSANGGEQPVWSPDGRSLYYASPQGSLLIRAKVSLAPTFAVASRDTVLRGGFDILPRNGHATYDVAADGRLLLVRRVSAATLPVVAIGWFEQVRAGIAR
ncbi:MAG: protein kinase [Gemmatimonadaceae bacterium]